MRRIIWSFVVLAVVVGGLAFADQPGDDVTVTVEIGEPAIAGHWIEAEGPTMPNIALK